MGDVRTALAEAARALGEVSDTPRLDAELLMAQALGATRDTVLLRYLDDAEPAGFAALVERRRGGEPLAYITGTRDFWTITLRVGPGVLIPRADSETLIEAAVAHFAGSAGPRRILDLGTGPGTLLLAALAEWRQATGLGIDASAAALAYARANAAALVLPAEFRLGDWAEGVDERFDLILANPPYVAEDDPDLASDVRAFEPAEALFAADEGLEAYRAIVPELPRLLAPGGVAALEIGWRQGEAVAALVAATGRSARVVNDLGGRPRAVFVT
ncbi:protein-(glutamine-N5) methyltransferase, release factor-specific [Sphingomonas spermidinifaciens]|uniref:Release factor glutamine methyltransferase n=1 Tax=Sphingomonas spermidinifaciens TaxID=1141889 RepID=A0A2A4B9T6_9SPHN|nr:peptide chain release factor N(5)-glutamine methyltransferase [Sphingomonas spermidinifaciens]PCD04568.1 protein-(glutamine-N5) methyltransferase, release factor-specific [Sphingomonas spermidinifaciens]